MTRWPDVQMKICRKCIDGDGRGNCRLPVDEECALERNFDTIVGTIENTHATAYEAYVAAMRSAVCAPCIQQDESGNCWKRNRLECALDRYYPIVIDLIEHHLTENVP